MADVPRVLEEFERGATIVLQGLHHNWLPLARYCRRLEAFFGHPVQANAYYTPAGSQGLPVHHDTHEVISLQVAGSKRWLVYEPVLELPLKNQRYRSALGEPGEPVLDVTLRAGDTLYLPRGWLHQALTSDEDSLHITVGINVRRWIDEARAELDEAENELAFRQTIDAEEPPELPTLDADAVRARARARFVDTADGRSSTASSPSCVRSRRSPATTELERRDTVIADLDGTTLSFEGRTLRFPDAARAGARVPRHDRGAVPRLPSCRESSTTRAASCSSGGSCARGSCDEALRPAEPGRRAREVGRRALLDVHVDLVGRPRSASTSARQPSPSPAIERTPNVVEAEQRRRLPHRDLRRLGGEAVARSGRGRAARWTRPLERRLDDGPGLRRLDAPVVDAVGEHDDVAGEAVAADVRRLPDPAVLDLLARPRRRAAGRTCAQQRSCLPCVQTRKSGCSTGSPAVSEVEPDQVVVALELEAAELALGSGRAGDVGEEAVACCAARSGGRRGCARAGAGARSLDEDAPSARC